MSGAWVEASIGLGICLVLALLGIAVLRILLPRVNVVDGLALGFPLGVGIATWFLFLASWAGIVLTPTSVGVTWGILLALAIVSSRMTRPGAGDAEGYEGTGLRPSDLPPRHLAVGLLILTGLACLAAWLAVRGSYYAWDDMAIWAVKGYGIAREGSIWAAAHWGDHGLNYPLNIPLLIAAFRFTGDALPVSKLAFPVFYLSLAVGCLRFWLQRGVRARVALLGTLCLASTPLLFEHATLGYANLPYTVYLVLGCAEAIQGFLTQDARRQVLSGLLLGLAGWTRPEGALAVASIMVVLGLAACLVQPRGPRLLAWVLPAAALAGVWLVFVGEYAPGGQMQQALGVALESLAQGEMHLSAFYWIVRFMGRQAIEPTVWGVLPLACAVLLILGVRRLGRRSNPDAFFVGMAFLVVAAGVTLQFYLADFSGQLMNYLGNSANRMYMPAVVMAALLALLSSRSSAGDVASPAGLRAQEPA